MKPQALRRHIEELCAENYIRWWSTRYVRASAVRYRLHEDGTVSPEMFEPPEHGVVRGEIFAPPVRGELSYATALHEIGHIVGRHQDSLHRVVKERWAWEWARRNALIWTTGRMERFAQRHLASYLARSPMREFRRFIFGDPRGTPENCRDRRRAKEQIQILLAHDTRRSRRQDQTYRLSAGRD